MPAQGKRVVPAVLDEPRAPVQPSERERPAVRQLEAALSKPKRALLFDPDGGQIEFPKSVYNVLVQVVHAMSRGNAVAVIPISAVLTTQQAADILNVSRPYLIQLLDEKAIPFEKSKRPGSHRRIRLEDLLAYKSQRSSARRKVLEELTHEAEGQGRYD
jgi:excisionase family DNA binding protein